MKTNPFKRMVLPVAVALLGAGGAFVTTSMGKADTFANQQGYRFVSAADPCHSEIMCRTEDGDICTLGSVRLWGKVTPSATTCNVPLFKIPN